MPKLAPKDRKKVETAEAMSFEPLEPGKYTAALSKVEAKVSSKGNSYWSIEVKDIVTLDGDKKPGKLWANLMLPVDKMPKDYRPRKADADPKESWATYQNITAARLKEFFEAFGYTVDTDTDEMLGERCVVIVGVETQQAGANAGKERNVINGFLPLTGDEASGGDEDDDDDDF